MSHDVHQVRSFEHPARTEAGQGDAEGRQVDPTAAHDIERLLATGRGGAIS